MNSSGGPDPEQVSRVCSVIAPSRAISPGAPDSTAVGRGTSQRAHIYHNLHLRHPWLPLPEKTSHPRSLCPGPSTELDSTLSVTPKSYLYCAGMGEICKLANGVCGTASLLLFVELFAKGKGLCSSRQPEAARQGCQPEPHHFWHHRWSHEAL